MSASAALLGVSGTALLFLPHEIADRTGAAGPIAALALQLLGAALFALAILDWTGRGGLLGGIYGRPVTLTNLSHFLIAALTLLKAARTQSSPFMLIAGLVCALFAAGFALLLFRHPSPPPSGVR